MTQELGRMSDTLRGGISDLGRSRLAGEQQKTRGALLDYNLGRNRAQDERAEKLYALQEPVLRQGAAKAEADWRKGQQVATWAGERGDDVYKNMVFARTIVPKFMKLYDAKPDMEGGQFKLRRNDGTLIKEIDRDPQAEAEAILSSYKVASTFKDQIQRIEEKEQRLNAQGIPATDPAYEKLAANKIKAQSVLDSPEKMIRVLEGQLAQLSKYGHYPEDIKRIKGEIRIEQAKLMTPKELAAEQRAIEAHKETMALRKIQMKNAEKAAKSAGKTTVKLSPGEAAKKQALLEEYKYNLKIQEKFKTQEPAILGKPGAEPALTQEDYDEAVSKNIAIMNQLEELGVVYDMNSLADQLILKGREMQGKIKAVDGSSPGKKGQKVSVNRKTGIVRVEYPDGKIEYFNQNKERVTEDGKVLKNLQKIKQ